MQALDDAPTAQPPVRRHGPRGPVNGGEGRRRTPVHRASGAPPRALWRSSAIVAIKLVRSAIFLVNSAAILHLFVAGLRDRPSRWTGAALAVALAESTVFVANHGRCPLTDVAEGLGAESGRVSDIFLPRRAANRIPQLCTPPLLIGVLALGFHSWRHSSRREKRWPRG